MSKAWNEKANLSSIRLKVLDGRDDQVWVQSSISATHKLPRNDREDFSFSRTDLVVIQNRGEDFCTLSLECVGTAESALFIGSNRRAGVSMRGNQGMKILMKPGEALTARSVDALEPGGAGVSIRPGQSIAVAV
jgi:hypothetical protein